MRFAVRPLEQRLLQLTLEQLHEAVRLRVVVDAAAKRQRADGRALLSKTRGAIAFRQRLLT